jgi:probable F420-dependent oxidoreductase
MTGMLLGVGLPAYGPWADRATVDAVARSAEELGYASAWTSQRLLYALEPQNDYPPLPGQPWPAEFRRVLDPLATLGWIAGRTSRIRLGTAVLNLPFYAPPVLAKELATLDLLSDGRLDVGVGLGWSKDEFAAAGTPYERRGARVEEFLRCLRSCWDDDEVVFDGEFYQVPRSHIEPKPLQRPGPPLLVGGYVEASIRRAVTLGDGFIGGNLPLERISSLLGNLEDACVEAGRDPRTVRVVSRGSVRMTPAPQGPDRRPLWGSLEEIQEDIARYADAGLTELFLDCNFDPAVNTVEPSEALERVLIVLEACAPQRRSADTPAADA